MKIISISGLDGSGKSTQIVMLKNELEMSGQKVFHFHAVSFSVANKILLPKTSHHQESGIKYPNNSSAVASAGKFKIFLRKIALLVDICRFSKLCNKLAGNGYKYVLTDRYFYDQIVNILYLEQGSNFSFSKVPWWQNIAEKNIKKPDIAVYLQVNPETILGRYREIEQGKAYLEKKKKIYDFLGRRWGLRFVDGNIDKNEVFTVITSLLES